MLQVSHTSAMLKTHAHNVAKLAAAGVLQLHVEADL